jgi:hypothetical protein
MDMDEKENSLYSGNTEEQNMENGEKVSSGDLFTVLNEERENTENLSSVSGESPLVKTLSGEDTGTEEKEDPSFSEAQLLPGTTMEEIRNVPEENREKQLEEVCPPSASAVKKEEKKIDLRRLTGHTAGQVLAAARNEKGMSIEEVAAATLIRADYITALEDDNIKNLPPVIFVKAYVRSLSKLYNLNDESIMMLKELLAELEPAADVPEKVVDELNKNVQINEEEARKVRLTGYYILGTLALLLILIISLTIYFAAVKGKNVQQGSDSGSTAESTTQHTTGSGHSARNGSFDASGITGLIPQIIPEEKILPMPAKKKRSSR